MSPQHVILPSYAKVNLFLEVMARRDDGFHELVTLFERISLADELGVVCVDGEAIFLECTNPALPTDDTNLVIRAAEAYQNVSGWKQGLHMTLKKRIPMGAGLGGGSSNAAVTLMALQQLNPNPLPEQEVHDIAASLGSDLNFFLLDAPFGLGTGRGEAVEPVEAEAKLWHVLVRPNFAIPTKDVFAALSLTDEKQDVTLILHQLGQGKGVSPFNGLGPAVEAAFPAIREVIEAFSGIAEIGAPCVSGTGSCVYALAETQIVAEAAAQQIGSAHPDWNAWAVHTI